MPPGMADGWNPANDFRFKDRAAEDYERKDLGTVEKGKIADLVILEANPLESIGNTRKIDAVVFGGRMIPKADLQKMLADLARP